MANFWDLVNKVIRNADILLLVMDARMAEGTRNIEIEDRVKEAGKPLIYVLNKCDLVDKAFIEKYKEHNNIVTIEIRTVQPLTEGMRDKIVSILEKRRGITVELIEKIDPTLIGGFIVSTGTLRYDSSLAHSIRKLKKEFEENLYVREL